MLTFESKKGSPTWTSSALPPVRRTTPATHASSNPTGLQSPDAAHRSIGYDFSRIRIHASDTPSHDAAGKTGLPLTGEESWTEISGNDGPEVMPQSPVPQAPVSQAPAAEAPIPMDTGSAAATPPKLTKRNEVAPTGTNCGAFNWVIQWMLDKPTTKGGWVVQKIQNTHSIKTCDDAALDASKLPFKDSWYPFWEAWQIHKDQKVTTYAEGGDKLDDKFSSGGTGDGTKGTRTITGEAEFYDGLTLPDTFKVTDKAPTFILPTTKAAPALTGGTGSIAHNVKATWNCCGAADKKTAVEPT
jgi:hypothetical protein